MCVPVIDFSIESSQIYLRSHVFNYNTPLRANVSGAKALILIIAEISSCVISCNYIFNVAYLAFIFLSLPLFLFSEQLRSMYEQKI